MQTFEIDKKKIWFFCITIFPEKARK